MMLAAFSSPLPFTELLNRIVGGPVTSLLLAMGIHPHDPNAPIPNFVAMQILIVLVLTAFFLVLRAQLSVDHPSAWQHLMESLRDFVQAQSREIIGHHSEGFTPFLLTLGLFLLASNLLFLIPGLESPTANPRVPLGCALVSFGYYHSVGLSRQGLHYFKQFVGPVWALAWLMVPIELISHTARIMSLTIRLFANIFAGDMLTLAFFSLIPVGIPTIFMALHTGVALIQTYIFVLLITVYLGGAVSEEH